MSVAVWSGSGLAWDRELLALKSRLGPVFGRLEVRASAGAFIDGLLSGTSRKTGWLLTEQAGLDRPCRMQSLLGRRAVLLGWPGERVHVIDDDLGNLAPRAASGTAFRR